MARSRWVCLGSVVLAVMASAAQLRAQPAVPAALEPWRAWVLKDAPDHACAFRATDALCVWPGRLSLDLDAAGGRFEQRVALDREAFLALPGAAGRWPLEVKVDGRLAPVVEQDGVPSLRLAPGTHLVQGRFTWPALPERLELARGTALVDLRIDGQGVAFPRRDEQGQLWLLAQGSSEQQGEQLALTVSRKIADGVPMLVTTRIALRVAGRAREVTLGRVLLPGTRPLAVSSELPARLEEQGELRVQVRAGTYRIEVQARSERALDAIAFASAGGAWPQSETWVWQADEALRQVELSGGAAVDPNRTELDSDWHGMPAYVLRAGDKLALATTRRGEATPPPNQVKLERTLWLDLDGRGYTVRDNLSAQLHQGFRLDLLEGELGHVVVGGEDQLITRAAHGKGSGVELRAQNPTIVAEWRAPQLLGSLPAVGWSEDVQSLSATLNLGPGYSVFAADGVDTVDQTWLSDWDLFALFFVLLCSIAISRLFGMRYLPLALVTLVLLQHEADAPGSVWVALLILIALLRVIPRGWFRNAIRIGFALTVTGMLLVAIPFAAEQIRIALHPQLGTGAGDIGLERLAMVSFAKQEMVPVSAPAPAAPAPTEAQEEAMDEMLESEAGGALADTLAGSRGTPQAQNAARAKDRDESKLGYGSALQQDPEATSQTGPGVPTWRWRSWQLSWSGPVDRSHRIELYLIPPWATRLLALLRVLLLGALIAVFLRGASAGSDKPGGSSQRPPATPSGRPGAAQTAVSAGALVLALLLAVPARAQAQAQSGAFPDKAMLDALRARLTEPAPCQGSCSAIEELALAVNSSGLTLTLTVHAQALTSVALPGPAASWVPASATLDGKADAPLVLLDDGFLHVRVEPGVHVVVARGALPPNDTLTLAVLDRPRRGRVQAEGYKVDGVREDGQVEAALQLSRLLAAGGDAPLQTAALPPWLRLERRFELGPTWLALNRLTRVSPPGTPLRVQVPMLAGEAVTDSAIEVSGDQLQVSFGRDEQVIEWSSRLQTRDELALVAAAGRPFSERWTIACGPIWHCTTQGLAPVGRSEGEAYAPEFSPWPGERLTLAVARPEPAKGHSVTIDSLQLDVTPGVRMRAARLHMSLRTSRGATQTLELPAGARVQSQQIDGETRPLRQDGSRLQFTLGPGAHNVAIEWQEPQGMEVVERVRPVQLHRRASNATLQVHVPQDRWLLWASGPAWGPAILFWGYLAFVLLLAFALGRVARSPLRTWQWLLLGLGLTQIPAPAAMAVVGWFFALAYRERMADAPRWLHNLVQIALVFLSFSALGCLFEAVHSGLLLQPDMQVAGAGSSGSQLNWYVDQVESSLPSATIVSVPMWSWRLLMLLWSLWLASRLVRWLPWAFRCFKAHGLWRKAPPRPPRAPFPVPAAAAPIPPATPAVPPDPPAGPSTP